MYVSDEIAKLNLLLVATVIAFLGSHALPLIRVDLPQVSFAAMSEAVACAETPLEGCIAPPVTERHRLVPKRQTGVRRDPSAS